jgi:hypothetical protein
MEEIFKMVAEMMFGFSSENESEAMKSLDPKDRRIVREFKRAGAKEDATIKHLEGIKRVVADGEGFISYSDIAMSLVSDDKLLRDVALNAIACAESLIEDEKKEK